MEFFKFDPSQPILRYNKWFPIYLHQLSVLLLYSWMLLNNYQLTKMLLVRDHWQITFITLNRFCALIKKNPTSLFLIDNIKLDGVPTKIKWKIHTLLYFKFKVPLIKIYKINHQIFYLLLFYIVFSADIIFHKFLELHSTLSEKTIFVKNFLFLTDSLKPPPPSHIFLTTKICSAVFCTLFGRGYTARGSTPYNPWCRCQQLAALQELMMNQGKFLICFFCLPLLEMSSNFQKTAIFHFWAKAMLSLNPFSSGILWKTGIKKKQNTQL